MNKVSPIFVKIDEDEEDEDKDKIHSISIFNFAKKIETKEDTELLEICRCICCCCLIFTDYPEKICKWLIKK